MINECDFFGKPIYIYTRSQAIADGILVDVTKMSEEVGFKIPTAVTDTVWKNYIEWTDEDSKHQICQDTNGRLWDVLSMLRFAIARNRMTNHVYYKLYVVPRDGKTRKARLTQLKAVIGAGDSGEPVITIMLPNED